ncbi:MAG: exosortase C-terminal domain/associated protein EpsI, partial [Paracoccaceae bacterium]
FRIGVIGVLVDSYGIEQAEGFLHIFQGWVIFVFAVVLLFLLAVVLQRLSRDPKPLSETIDLDFEQFGSIMARTFRIKATAGLIGAAVLTLGVSTALVLAPDPQRIFVERNPFVLFPLNINGWNGSTAKLDDGVATILAADDYLNATFSSQSEEQYVNLFIAFYKDQTNGSGIHSPEVCLPVGGWEIFSFDTYNVDMSDTVYGQFDLNRAIIQKGTSQQLVYYWFEQQGKRVTGDVTAKMRVLINSVGGGRSDGALIRFVTPIKVTESVADADARILRFMRDSLPRIPRFVPV